jgi:hypothetical protein
MLTRATALDGFAARQLPAAAANMKTLKPRIHAPRVESHDVGCDQVRVKHHTLAPRGLYGNTRRTYTPKEIE